MARHLPRVVASVSLAGLAACSSGGPGPRAECVPGLVEGCTLPGGGDGARACGPGGKYETCERDVAGAVPDPTGEADYRLDFGARAIGEPGRATLPVRNLGSEPIEFVAERPPAPFASELAGPLRLGPGEAGELGWSFAPQGNGTFAAVARFSAGGHALAVRLAGESFEPSLECTPASLDFGEVSRRSESRREVSCVNTAPGAWSPVAGPLAGADPESFGVGPLPPGPVRAGAAWRFEAIALARRPGPLSATLPLVTASGRAVTSLALSAEGAAAALSCAPASLDFGYVAPGAVRTMDLVCANASIDPIRITRVSLDASSEPRFAWSPGEGPFDVPGRVGEDPGRVSFAVTFAPTPEDLGARRNGRLVLETDDSTLPRLEVALTGFGGGPAIACGPAPLDFGMVAHRLPITRSFACTNVGLDEPARTDDNLVVTGFDTTDPADFGVTVHGGIRPGGYGVGQSFTVDVTYDPAEAGTDRASIRLFTNATSVTDGAPYEVAVSGEGLVLPPCDVALAPGELRFGQVARTHAATLEFAIRNRLADGACMVRDLRLAVTCDPEFSLPAGEVPLALLPAGGELRIPVEFHPRYYQDEAPYTCDVLFDVSDPGHPHRVVPARGSSRLSCVSVDTDDLDFGAVPPGCASRARAVRLVNDCDEVVEFAVEPNAGASDEFVLASAPAEWLEVAAGESATIEVAYRPGDEGEDRGSVGFYLEGNPEPLLATYHGRGAIDGTQVDGFEQRDHPKADVLFVIDDGMIYRRGTAAIEPSLFLAYAREHVIDFQLGVTTGTLSSRGFACGEDGRLYPLDYRRPRILTADTPDLDALLAEYLLARSCTGDGQVLEAAYRALHPPASNHADDPRYVPIGDGNQGFLRPDAHLSIVAVSDKVDVSPGSVDDYYHALLALKGTSNPHLVNFLALAGDRFTGCSSTYGAAADGDRLISLAERTEGGLFRSICATDLVAATRDLSAAAFGAQTCFPLRGRPDDLDADGAITGAAGELAVRQNGVDVPSIDVAGGRVWRYRDDLVAVCFEPGAAPPPGSQLDVAYRVACGNSIP